MKRFLILIISLMLVITLIACAESGTGESTGDAVKDTVSDAAGSPDVTDPPSGDTSAAGETTAEPEPDTDAVTTFKDRTEPEPELDAPMEVSEPYAITVDSSVRHQMIESFGASGAWWAQAVGKNTKTRDRIAELLFDPVEGIGLNGYRYNIGGGSQDKGSKSTAIGDLWRRAYSFEKSPGEYDWSRDKAAVWFMEKAAELGVDEITMFVNSPIERLTRSGKAYADYKDPNKNNLAPENYEAFAQYVLDVAEHFKSEGLPIKFISPINEPQYDWDDVGPGHVWAQEGCHYDNKAILNVLKVFVNKIGERSGLRGVEICAPDGGSWNDDTLAFSQMIMKDKTLGSYFTAIDNHSYWSETGSKKNFKAGIEKVSPDVKLRESEWCEMTNGRDLSMDSALTLASTVYEDMTILDCVSWQYWIAVSCYDYRDGLIYTDASGNNVQVPKRLWSLGNYSRYIDRGYTRIDCSGSTFNLCVSAYEGTNEYGEPETVVVIVNKSKNEKGFSFPGVDTSVYNRISVVTTDKSHNLEETYYSEFTEDTAINVSGESVTTVIISGRK